MQALGVTIPFTRRLLCLGGRSGTLFWLVCEELELAREVEVSGCVGGDSSGGESVITGYSLIGADATPNGQGWGCNDVSDVQL